MKNNKIMMAGGQRSLFIAGIAIIVSALGLPTEAATMPIEPAPVKVSLLRSWGGSTLLPVFQELNDNWSDYGTTPVTIDASLKNVTSFTYQDLVATEADVLFLSDPAGGREQYSQAEIDAIEQYVMEGHSIIGTFKVFEHAGHSTPIDNRALAPLFGLRSDIEYNLENDVALQSFEILAPSALFQNLSDTYVSSSYAQAQVPADDLSWGPDDQAGAEVVACTADNRGVITWYQTESYHAIYVSEMVEYNGSPADTQFLYNAITIPEPFGFLLLGMGAMTLIVFKWRRPDRNK